MPVRRCRILDRTFVSIALTREASGDFCGRLWCLKGCGVALSSAFLRKTALRTLYWGGLKFVTERGAFGVEATMVLDVFW